MSNTPTTITPSIGSEALFIMWLEEYAEKFPKADPEGFEMDMRNAWLAGFNAGVGEERVAATRPAAPTAQDLLRAQVARVMGNDAAAPLGPQCCGKTVVAWCPGCPHAGAAGSASTDGEP